MWNTPGWVFSKSSKRTHPPTSHSIIPLQYHTASSPFHPVSFVMGNPSSTDAKKQRALRRKKRQLVVEDGRKLLSSFPYKELKVLKDGDIGRAQADYGGKFKSLQFQRSTNQKESETNSNDIPVGKVTMGLYYENDQKLRNLFGTKREGSTLCQKSERHKTLLLAVKNHLEKFNKGKNPHDMTFMRIQFIRGAFTVKHTDSFRGSMEGSIMPLGVGYRLVVSLFPRFRCSVISIRNFYCIPYSLDAEFLIVLNWNSFQGIDEARKIQLSPGDLDLALPVGDLPFVVVGNVRGKLQIAVMKDHYAASPKEYDVLSLKEARARLIQNNKFPTQKHRAITQQFKWSNFSSWKYAHRVTSGFMVPRIAVFYRFLRENPGSANKSRMTDVRPFTELRKKYLWQKKDNQEGIII